MSQVKFRAVTESGPVEVMAGWDRPLREYFMTIFDLTPNDDNETVWSTIDHYSAENTFSTKRLRKQLTEMGLLAPEGFWELVERQEANVTYTFENGAWRKE